MFRAIITRSLQRSGATSSSSPSPLSLLRSGSTRRRSFSQLHSASEPPSFGIAFDIDGVILRGHTPIGNSPQALRRLYQDSGILKIPYLFLTNGGGIPEFKRALELSKLLGVNILPSQVLQGHTPFKELVNRFENDLIVAVGKGEPATVMYGYGFNGNNTSNKISRCNDFSERVQAAFIVSDPVDWSRDIQVLCDILRTGGLPGRELAHQPPLYFAHDDLKYQAEFPYERFGLGAFRIALENIYNSIHPEALKYTCFGKPYPFVFKNAEYVLKRLHPASHRGRHGTDDNSRCQTYKTLYMIGDNPLVDIKGARQAGYPWFSILTRTGVFKGKENHEEFPADLVVDTVEDAVDYILRKECNV